MVLTPFPVAHQILLESIQKLNHLIASSEGAKSLSKNMFDFEYHKMIIWIEVAGVELCQMPFGSLKVQHLFVTYGPLHIKYLQ